MSDDIEGMLRSPTLNAVESDPIPVNLLVSTEMDECIAWIVRAVKDEALPGDVNIVITDGDEVGGMLASILRWRATRKT